MIDNIDFRVKNKEEILPKRKKISDYIENLEKDMNSIFEDYGLVEVPFFYLKDSKYYSLEFVEEQYRGKRLLLMKSKQFREVENKSEEWKTKHLKGKRFKGHSWEEEESSHLQIVFTKLDRHKFSVNEQFKLWKILCGPYFYIKERSESRFTNKRKRFRQDDLAKWKALYAPRIELEQQKNKKKAKICQEVIKKISEEDHLNQQQLQTIKQVKQL